MTDNDRLHMAVKYSTIEYEKKIESVGKQKIVCIELRKERMRHDVIQKKNN